MLFLLTLGGIYALSALSRAQQWNKHTDQVRVALGQLFSTLVDAESGLRGYAVAGEPAFLEGYQRAQSSWQAQFNRLRTLTTDNVGQQQRLERLHALAGKRLVLLSDLRAARQAGRQGSQLTAEMMEGKRTMDAFRVLLGEMDQEERRLDEVRQRDAIVRWRWTIGLFIGGTFALWFVVIAASFQRREAEARRVHAGEAARANELFRVVLQGTELGITVQDPTGRLVYANDAAARLIGFTSPAEVLAAAPAEIMARFELLTFEGKPFPAAELPGRAALQGHTTEELQLRFKIRATKEERWSLVRAVPARDPAGKVIYAINFFREVSEEVRDQGQRAFLLRAIDELNSSLDYEKTLAAVAQLAVPVLADWCAIDLVDGDTTKRLAIAHVDPAKATFLAELQRRYPSHPNSPTGVPHILRTGKAEFIPEIPPQLLRDAAVDDEHMRLIDELQLHSYIAVPLKARGKTIGAVTIAHAESGRRYTEKDLELAHAVADRAALAIDNARLFREAERARLLATSQRDQSEERFQLMVESVKDYAIFMLDPKGIITTWNAGAQLIKGYRPHEIIGRHFSCFYDQEEVSAGKCERELEIAIREGRFEEEGWRRRKNGSRFWADIVITAIVGKQGQLMGFAKVTRDLTERRRSQGQLATEARRRLAAENETRFAEVFIGILGHDLRNPLNAISMATNLIKRVGSATPQALDRILLSTERMSNMVAQLLDLTRSRLAGGIPIEKRPSDLQEVVEGALEELRLAHRGREIRFEKGAEVGGFWDTDRLAQVVSNLVGNALEHGDPSRAVTVRLSSAEDAVRLAVHNFGPSIPAEVISAMFDPYRRTTVRSERSGGLGLGLFITQQIVVAHGGTIDCRSTDQEGTTMTVSFPRPADENDPAIPAALVS